MKNYKIFLVAGCALAMASCTEDFTTTAEPQSNPQENILQVSDVTTTKMTVSPVDYNVLAPETEISLATVSVKEGQIPEGAYVDATVEVSVKENFSESATIAADTMSVTNQTIMITVQNLQNVINNNGKGLYLKNDPVTVYVRSTLRVVNGTSICNIGNPETTYFAQNSFTYTPQPVLYGDFLYYVGTTGGWNQTETGTHQKLNLTDLSKGKYQGYFYQTEESYGNTFRFLKTLGSWDDAIGYSDFTKVEGDVKAGSSDNNFEATKGTGVYYFEVSLLDMTIKVTKIDNMNLVGDFNGWNQKDDAQQMTWDAANFCYVKTGAGVNANGWKFTANNAWDINLGTDINDLKPGGDNLSNVGTTIKLYPCGTSATGKMVATVE